MIASLHLLMHGFNGVVVNAAKIVGLVALTTRTRQAVDLHTTVAL